MSDPIVLTAENSAEFYAKKLDLQPVDTVAEQAAEELAKVDEKAAEQAEPEIAEEEHDEEKKPNPRLQKRFSELTQARKEAQARADAAEAKLRELQEAKAAPAPIEADGGPDPNQFASFAEYQKALAVWAAEEVTREQSAERQKREQQEKVKTVVDAAREREIAFRAEHPDYDEVLDTAAEIRVSDVVRDAILESDSYPQIVYWMAQNQAEAKKIAGMTPAAALKAIGRLEARFESETKPDEQKREVRVSKAPEPISPIRGGTGKPDVLVTASGEFPGTYKQWKEARRAGRIK